MIFFIWTPPYIIEQSNLYGSRGDMHKTFDHEKLRDILGERKNWLLSYNDCIVTRELYKDFKIETPEWIYSMGRNKQSRELLIFST